MRRLARTLVIPIVVLSGVPALADERAGVVTSAEGRVTVARATASAVSPLKFKDEVFLRDRVSTGVDSLARLLLGGKAVITVREHSSVTITEVPGKSIVEVSTGRMALSVARERMKAGESIEVRTPNAVASVRGTVLVTEVSGAGESVSSAFTVVRGRVDVSQLGPQNVPVGAVISVGAMQTAGVSAGQGVGPARPITPQALQQLSADFSVRVIPPPPAATASLVSHGQVSHAVTQTTAILQGTESARAQGVSARGDIKPEDANKGSERGKSDEAPGARGQSTTKFIVAPVAAAGVKLGGPTPSSDVSLGRRVNDKIQKETVPVSQVGNSSGSNGGSAASSNSSGGNSGGGGSSNGGNSSGGSSSVAANSGGGSKSDNAGASGGSSSQSNGNGDKASGKSGNAKGRVKK